MGLNIEGIKQRVEHLFQPKPIEVVVPAAKWDMLQQLYRDGLHLPNNEKPSLANKIHNVLREIGLNVYYDVYLGRVTEEGKEEPYFRVKPDYESTYVLHNLEDGTTVHLFRFTRVKPQRVKH
jgi:hypothetical protein